MCVRIEKIVTAEAHQRSSKNTFSSMHTINTINEVKENKNWIKRERNKETLSEAMEEREEKDLRKKKDVD